MIDGLGYRVPPIAVKAAAVPVEPPARVKPHDNGTSPLATAAKALAAEPPVDITKVDRIRSAIALGTYKVDPPAIAARMIAAARDRG